MELMRLNVRWVFVVSSALPVFALVSARCMIVAVAGRGVGGDKTRYFSAVKRDDGVFDRDGALSVGVVAAAVHVADDLRIDDRHFGGFDGGGGARVGVAAGEDVDCAISGRGSERGICDPETGALDGGGSLGALAKPPA